MKELLLKTPHVLIFDFDGLIVDTEWPEFQAWQELCQHYNVELSIEAWLPCIGTGATTQVFDPHTHVETLVGCTLDREEVRAAVKPRHIELIEMQPVLPGVETLLREAKQRGLGLAVASSSPRTWVEGHLSRLGLLDLFDTLACGNEVKRTKPYPDLYLTALDQLGAQAQHALAFEDSLNGMRAAQQAGIFCVVIPNALTQHMTFEPLNLRLASLADATLDELLAHVS